MPESNLGVCCIEGRVFQCAEVVWGVGVDVGNGGVCHPKNGAYPTTLLRTPHCAMLKLAASSFDVEVCPQLV